MLELYKGNHTINVGEQNNIISTISARIDAVIAGEIESLLEKILYQISKKSNYLLTKNLPFKVVLLH